MSRQLTVAASISIALASAATVGQASIDIDPANVHRLQLAFSFRLGSTGAEGSAPASAAGLLYVMSSFPHTLYALDAAAPPDSRVRWRHEPAADLSAAGLSCCDRSAHGPVVDSGRVIFTTLDGHVVALDAASGELRFDVRVADTTAGETLAGAPLVAEGRVFVGSGGSDFGSRGWIAGLDSSTGTMAWKQYSTGPDGDVGIGPAFKPYYASLRANDLGVRTWPPSAWQQGGGSVAGSLLYDAAARAVLHATGRPAPWNAEQRQGDNRWTSGFFSRDMADGSARWFTGFNAHDPYAFHESGSDLLLDPVRKGQALKLLVHPDANGWLYVVDRSTGQILSADAVVPSVVSGVDLASGETHLSPSQMPKLNQQTRHICPAWTGAFAGAASVIDDGELVALAISRLCMDIEPRQANFIKGTPYTGANVRLLIDRGGSGGIVGWNVAQRKASWEVREPWPVMGGTAATETGLVFYGTLDGFVKALDGHSGKLLWQFKAPSGIISRPLVYQGSDGRPYLAIVAGAGRLYGMSRVEGLDPRDKTAGFGLAGLLGQLPQDKDTASTLLVFRLP